MALLGAHAHGTEFPVDSPWAEGSNGSGHVATSSAAVVLSRGALATFYEEEPGGVYRALVVVARQTSSIDASGPPNTRADWGNGSAVYSYFRECDAYGQCLFLHYEGVATKLAVSVTLARARYEGVLIDSVSGESCSVELEWTGHEVGAGVFERDEDSFPWIHAMAGASVYRLATVRAASSCFRPFERPTFAAIYTDTSVTGDGALPLTSRGPES